jgi:hypothetical protein
MQVSSPIAPRAPARLAVDPRLQRAFELERGEMILGVALRGIAYGELEIPVVLCDPQSRLAQLDSHVQPQKMQ